MEIFLGIKKSSVYNDEYGFDGSKCLIIGIHLRIRKAAFVYHLRSEMFDFRKINQTINVGSFRVVDYSGFVYGRGISEKLDRLCFGSVLKLVLIIYHYMEIRSLFNNVYARTFFFVFRVPFSYSCFDDEIGNLVNII